MIELSEEQRQELSVAEPTAIDPSTMKTYVLVQKSVYDRVKRLFYDNGEGTDDELRLLLAKSAEANGWNESAMDDYDDYEAKRAKTCLSLAKSSGKIIGV